MRTKYGVDRGSEEQRKGTVVVSLRRSCEGIREKGMVEGKYRCKTGSGEVRGRYRGNSGREEQRKYSRGIVVVN